MRRRPPWISAVDHYSSQQCQEGHWVIYYHHFRLKVYATRCKEWASIDINIWNIAFPGWAFAAATVKGFRKPGSGATGYCTQLGYHLAKTKLYASIGMMTPALTAPTQTTGLNTAAIAVFAILESRTTAQGNVLSLQKEKSPTL